MFKKSKIIFAIIMAVTLCIGILTPSALAEEWVEYPEAAITKVLNVPIGTNVPTGSFTFTFDPVSINDDASLKTSAPVIGTAGVVSIAFPVAPAAYTYTEQVGDVDLYYLESAELFGSIVWPYTGIFEYSVTENEDTFSLESNEYMKYSEAVYTVKVHVREYTQDDADAGKIPGNKRVGDLYVFTVGVYRTTNDDGTTGTVKVDPTPGGNGVDYFYSQMTFGNIYARHTGGGGTDPLGNNTLSVSKTVTGAYSSTSIYFDFEVTVTKPSLVPDTPLYKAYIVDNGSVLTDLTANGLPGYLTDTGGAYVNFTSGIPLDVKLRHGQYLAFTTTHVGSSYIVTETGVAGYTPKAIVTYDDTPGAEVTGLMGKDFKIPDGTIYTVLRVGEKLNRAAITNVNDGVIEAGLNISDLPFYGLILLAVGGIAILVVIKTGSRRDK